jgi:hypothetical protein
MKINEYKYADKIETLIKTNLNKTQIRWLLVAKICILVNFLIGVFNTTARSDFINIIVPFSILVILNTVFHSNRKKHLKNFVIIMAFSIFYDIIWFLFTETV